MKKLLLKLTTTKTKFNPFTRSQFVVFWHQFKQHNKMNTLNKIDIYETNTGRPYEAIEDLVACGHCKQIVDEGDCVRHPKLEYICEDCHDKCDVCGEFDLKKNINSTSSGLIVCCDCVECE
jgi:hypothetical protein